MLGTLDPTELSEEPDEDNKQLITEDVVINDHAIDYIGNYWNRKEVIAWATAFFTLTMLTYACRNCMPLSAVAMSKEFDWDKSETGLILSSFYWGYVTTTILSGFLSDRFGGDQVVTIATLVWGPLTIVYPFCAYAFDDKSSQLTFLVINRIIFGIVTGFHYPTISSIAASRVVMENRSFFYTAVGSGTVAGNVLSGSLGSYLLATNGWHIIYYVFGALATVSAIVVRVFLMKKRCLHPCTRIKTRALTTLPTTKTIWTTLARHRGFWAMIFMYICTSYSWHLTLSWLPTFFEENYPNEKGWVYNVLPWLFLLITNFISGYVADRLIKHGISITITRKFLQTVHSLSQITAFFLVGHTHCYTTALFIVTFSLMIGGFGSAGSYANPQDLVPEHAGAVYGVMNTCGAIPGFLGVYLSGHILEYFNSWSIVFSLMAAIHLLGWLVYVVFGSGEQVVFDY